MEFSLVVPLIPAHDEKLLRLFENLSQAPNFFSEIIIARSETKNDTILRIKENIEELQRNTGITCPVILAPSKDRCLAGENRNRGWQLASSEWVSFLDADDLYLPEKFSFQREVIEHFSDVNLILHDFYFESELDGKALPRANHLELTKLFHNSEIFFETFGANTSSLASLAGNTNIRIPGGFNVHHGHVTVRSDIYSSVKFQNTPRVEDGIFCQDLLKSLGGVVYIPAKLSVYIESDSSLSLYSGPIRKFKRTAKLFLLKTLSLVISAIKN